LPGILVDLLICFNLLKDLEAAIGIEPMKKGFAARPGALLLNVIVQARKHWVFPSPRYWVTPNRQQSRHS
jgi:hypothetical protein